MRFKENHEKPENGLPTGFVASLANTLLSKCQKFKNKRQTKYFCGTSLAA